MHIKRKIFETIMSSCPPETGGIFGGQKGVVTHFVFDSDSVAKDGDACVSSTEYLNAAIAKWQTEGMELLGIFHSHPKHAEMLPRADRIYIETVMQSLPASVSRLYFPMIIPQTDMVVFCAERRDGQTVIRQEKTVFVR